MSVFAESIPQLVPRSEEGAWYCERCQRLQYGARLVYGVSLCFLCVVTTAGDPTRAHHLACKCYDLEREVRKLRRINDNLRARLAIAEGVTPCF